MSIDLNTITEAVLSRTLATVFGAGILAGLAWFSGPLKWIIRNRELRRLISDGRRFIFTFNPKTGKSKFITFLLEGEIGEGRNHNEYTWRIRRGVLEIFAADGAIYSRFSHDKKNGLLKHTNEPNLRSYHGQYLQPSLVRVSKPAEQGI